MIPYLKVICGIKNKTSVINIAVAEQTKQSKINSFQANTSDAEYHDHPIRNKFFILAGTIIFLLGIAIVGVFYYINLSKNKTIQIVQNDSILNYDQKIKLSIASSTRRDLLQKIATERINFNMPLNSILYINILNNEKTADPQSVLQIISPQIPATLLRSVSGEYMFGVYSFDKNQPFIIFTVDDYGTAWSGMLKWEESVSKDLAQIFDISPDMSDSLFSDESFNNKDLRVLKNDRGQTILLYSFLDKNTVIITTNENIFNTLLQKFLTAQAHK